MEMTEDHSYLIYKTGGGGAGGGVSPIIAYRGGRPPKRGILFRLQVYNRVGISQVDVYKRIGKSVI